MTTPVKRRLGVNIDHIATLRQARQVWYPEPARALSILDDCGVEQVTVHLREDRRHIQDHDVQKIIAANVLPVNLEMALTAEMVKIATDLKPHTVTIVPEKREEITTEGGLDCVAVQDRLLAATTTLKDAGIRVSIFVDPDCDQIRACQEVGANGIELHTGTYCNVIEDIHNKTGSYVFTKNEDDRLHVEQELSHLKEAAMMTRQLGLDCFAGHGLHVHNLYPVTQIEEIVEYNIGHAIIADAVFVGLKQAISDIQNILQQGQ